MRQVVLFAQSHLYNFIAFFRSFFLVTFLFVSSAFVILAQEAVDPNTDVQNPDSPGWKDKAKDALDTTYVAAKAAGSVVADKTVEGYKSTVGYFKNNTVGDIADDVGDGAKKAGSSIASGAKKVWGGITGLFNRR